MQAERFRGSRIRSQSLRNELIEKLFFQKPGSAGLFLFWGRMFRRAQILARRTFTGAMPGDGLGKLTMATKVSMPAL
jgi:hypothetical protein